jgi:hypothetical protein
MFLIPLQTIALTICILAINISTGNAALPIPAQIMAQKRANEQKLASHTAETKTALEKTAEKKASIQQAGMMGGVAALSGAIQLATKKDATVHTEAQKPERFSGENSVNPEAQHMSESGIMVVGDEQKQNENGIITDENTEDLFVSDSEPDSQEDTDNQELDTAYEMESYASDSDNSESDFDDMDLEEDEATDDPSNQSAW